MRSLCYALMLAVLLGAGTATAQEADKPKEKTLPWWKLSGDAPPKDQPQVKKDVPLAQRAEVRKKDSVRPDKEPSAPPNRRDAVPSDRIRPPVLDAPERRLPGPPPVRQFVSPQPRKRLVYRLANMPAVDAAQVVNELLRSERSANQTTGNVVVLSDAVTNSLIISGTSDEIHETVKLVEQLDTEPLMVCVQVVIGLVESREGFSLLAPNPKGPELSCSHEEACELIEQFSKSDAVKILARPQVMTLDNQPAFIQVGHRVPRVTGFKDGNVVATELENVGLIIGITPRITPDQVVTMEIDAEKSELGPEDQGVPLGVDAKGNVVRSPKIETMMVQTTVRIPPSRAVIIGGLSLQKGDERGELVFVVTPHVVARRK